MSCRRHLNHVYVRRGNVVLPRLQIELTLSDFKRIDMKPIAELEQNELNYLTTVTTTVSEMCQ